MKDWIELNKVQKVVLSLLFISAAALMPELVFLLDLGGVELMFALLMVYCKPFFMWLSVKIAAVKYSFTIAQQAIRQSAIAKPKVFFVHGAFCTMALALTGSFVLSAAFILPSLLGNGLLVS